jgi:RNA polymerase sigma-70 factor (ECF subfamily)
MLEVSRQFLLAIAHARLPPTLRAKGEASDLVQETLAAAYQAKHQFRGQTLGELRAWLRTILVNELATFRRHYETSTRNVAREKPLDAAQTEISPATPITEVIRREETRLLTRAVAGLPREYHLAVLLRVEDGLSFAGIGARLGCTEEAARKLFTRALERLRDAVHTST